VQVLRVQPCSWKELIVVGELLQEALQVDGQRVLPRDIVHPQEVVHALVRLQLREEVRRDAVVLPTDLPLQLFPVIVRGELLQLLQHLFILQLELVLLRLITLKLRQVGVLGVAPSLIAVLLRSRHTRRGKALQAAVRCGRSRIELARLAEVGAVAVGVGALNTRQLRYALYRCFCIRDCRRYLTLPWH